MTQWEGIIIEDKKIAHSPDFFMHIFGANNLGRGTVYGFRKGRGCRHPRTHCGRSHISWWKLVGPPGLAYSVEVEVAECLSDANGSFEIPRYSTLFKDYQMAVYKKGYVCWSSEDIFPTYEKRKDFRLKNGMVITMEHFKREYSKERHAYFTIGSATNRKGPGLFDDAIKSERDLLKEMNKKRWQNNRGK